MRQNLTKVALPLETWRMNFLLNLTIAYQYFGRGGPFNTQLTEKLSKFFCFHIAGYPGMDSAELVEKVMEAGLMWYLFFIPNFRFVSPQAIKHMKLLINHPIIPRSSLRQFFQKLVLNLVCYKHAPASTRNKLYTHASQEYLSELIDRWDSSDEFAIPYYHIILDTIKSGQTILMISPPSKTQLTELWTTQPHDIYNYLGRQYDASIGEFVHESVHGRRWADYKSFLLTHDPTNIILHSSLKHLHWIPDSKIRSYRTSQGNSRVISEFPW